MPNRDVEPQGPASDRLDSWKEIAAYLKRAVITVQRWEKHEGLPVHRHLHGKLGSVWANKSAVDAWWQNRRVELEHEREAASPSLAVESIPIHWYSSRMKLLFGAAAALIVFLPAFLLRGRLWPPTRASTSQVRLAVLPFDNLTGDPQQEYFSDGLMEEMITDLARAEPGRLVVVARASAMQFKGTRKSVAEVGQALRVDYILEGSVRRASDRVRVSAQLIRVRDETDLWAETFERQSSDLLTLQDDIARRVAQSLEHHLLPSQKPEWIRAQTGSVEAYQDYLMGRFYWNKRTEEGFRKAISYFEQAIAKDPNYAQAYAGLADCYVLLGYYSSLSPTEAYPKAKAAARKALELDPTLGEAHTSLAGALQDYDWDWPEVEREHKQAVELSPGYATAHQWYGNYLNMMGRFEEAQAQIRQARDLDPLSLIINCNLAWAYHFARNDDLALEELRKTKDMDPNFYWTHLALGRVYVQKKMYADAISSLERATELSGGNTMVLSELGHAYAVAGKRGDAQRILAKLQQASRQRYVSAYDVGLIYVGLGQTEEAMRWLEKAYREHCRSLQFSGVEPRLDPLRNQVRFQELLKQLGLLKPSSTNASQQE